MSREKVVVVGSGIMGLAHALTACEAGYETTVLERDERPLGASVRNFGTLWPIGCVPGAERDQALLGVKRWQALAGEASFWIRSQGSLSLAYREEAWDILQEFAQAGAGAADGFELLAPDAVCRRFPAAQRKGLRGALRSDVESVVNPPAALAALVNFARQRGVKMHFGMPVVKVRDDAVETSDGQSFAFDRLVIAAGEEMRLLFPAELAAAQIQRCRLQMMRTAPLPSGFDLGAIFVSDLTLCHYPAFRDCPSTPRLRARLAVELPRHIEWGVHVIAAQHDDGSLVLGDSHEYGLDFAPDLRADVEELVLGALQEFAEVPDLRIAARWHGVYLKSKIGQSRVVLHPRERVTMITATGGLGMTLSWGLAQSTVESWSHT